MVSVPLRGNGYRKFIALSWSSLRYVAFPSPCGVMVIGNRMRLSLYKASLIIVSVPLRGNGYRKLVSLVLVLNTQRRMFPSPCGVMVIGNNWLKAAKAKNKEFVSVPLRGNGYRKLLPCSFMARSYAAEFPSPCGVMVIGNLKLMLKRLIWVRRILFPSPCGVMVIGNCYI